jgi:hypothetical protein
MHFDAGSADCSVSVFRDGLLSAVGHDVTLRVTQFVIDIDGVAPAEAGAGEATCATVVARFDAGSLRVTGAVPPKDAREIERHAADDVLAARRHPDIRFVSSSVVRHDGGARIEGQLTLNGVTRALRCDAVADERGWHTEVRIDQRQFAIKPFSALLGTLKVKPEVLVRVTVPRW